LLEIPEPESVRIPPKFDQFVTNKERGEITGLRFRKCSSSSQPLIFKKWLYVPKLLEFSGGEIPKNMDHSLEEGTVQKGLINFAGQQR